MIKTETIDDVLSKKGSIEYLWEIIDPENKYPYKNCIEEWYRLDLESQRKMYLYLLYKKWRGEPFYGTPRDIITNCHPYPTNWNGRPYIDRLMEDKTPLVKAIHNGNPGIFTKDEAKVWQMTNVKPFNF